MSIPRILTSAKFQASAFATVLIAVPLIFTLTDRNVSRAEKQSATEKFIIATASLWGIAVGGTAAEDYAKNRDKPAGVGPVPSVMVNTGSDATNTQSAVPVAPRPAPAMPPSDITRADFQRTSTETR